MTHKKQIAAVVSQVNLNALQLGYDFENRALFLFGEIDSMTAYRFIAGFKWLDRTPGAIHVLLSSPGGATDPGIAIYETMRTANNPTIVEGLGIVASAAVPVLLAGTVRFLNPSTRVMIHNISFQIDGTLSTPEATSISESAEHFNHWYHELIAERTGARAASIEKWCAGETSFNAEEAVKLGFADKVLEAKPFPETYAAALEQVKGYVSVEVPKKRKGKK
jgi:ATP-dependent protease ClpP protease subunit